MQWALAEGSEFLFPGVLEGGEGKAGVVAGADDHHLPTYLRAAGIEDKRDAMHSFRVRRAASHIMNATAMNVRIRGVEVRIRCTQIRTVGVTASAAAAGVKHSRETASIEADALSLSEQFARSYTASPRAN